MDEELNAMPHALRLIADQITAPDHVPAMCLRDAAAMIESLAMQRDKLRAGIKAVLTENAHLADGEVCTTCRPLFPRKSVPINTHLHNESSS